MADTKITALTADASPTTDDLITTVDDVAGTPTNKKVTIANLDTLISGTTKTLTNKSLSDSTTYLIDESDNTKKLQFQLSGITTGTTRTVTIPNASTTLVGHDTTQTITNKTIGVTNTLTGKDSTFTIVDDGDNTKVAAFQASGISTGTTRTFTLPDASTTLVGHDATQTLTNKTVGVTNTLTGKDSTFTIVDDADNTKVAAFQASGITTGTTRTYTLPNTSGTLYVTGGTDVAVADGGTGVSTTPSNGQLLIGNGSGYTVANITAGSNITVTNGAGSITIAASGGGGGEDAFQDDGTTPTTAPSVNASATDAVAIGGAGAVVGSSGTNAAALQKANANANYGFASCINDNTTSYGSQGSYARAHGNLNLASGSQSGAIAGTSHTVSNTSSGAFAGSTNTVTSIRSAAIAGIANTVSATDSAAIAGNTNITNSKQGTILLGGYYAAGRVAGAIVTANGVDSTAGRAQVHRLVLGKTTSNATKTAMSVPHSDNMSPTASSAWGYKVIVTGKRASSNDCAIYEFLEVVSNNGGTVQWADGTTSDKSAVTSRESNASWDCVLSINAGAIEVNVTGVAATTIYWTALVEIIEACA